MRVRNRHSRRESKNSKYLSNFIEKERLNNFNFFDLRLEHQTQVTLPMLDLVWRREDGTRRKVAEELISDDEIVDQVVQLKVKPNNAPQLNKDLKNSVLTNRQSSAKRNKPKRTERNKSHRLKSRSLLRPTPVKNYKVSKNDDSEEDVISEMRSLTVRPMGRDPNENEFSQTHQTARIRAQELEIGNDVQIDPINPKTKNKLLKWLESINLIRRNAVSVKEFPQFCRNGVIFFDLVNKLSGRDQVLKGVHRNPKNISSINANFKKFLSYLRDFPKMNSRYLWSENLMMEGNIDVIWGFIDDVWHWHHNKISPHDKSKKNRNPNIKSYIKADNNTSFGSIGQEIKNCESCDGTVRVYNEKESF